MDEWIVEQIRQTPVQLLKAAKKNDEFKETVFEMVCHRNGFRRSKKVKELFERVLEEI